jgi:hypothetical protein
MSAIIVNEFKKSTLKAIEHYSKQVEFECNPERVQIGFELSANDEIVYRIFKEYSCVVRVELDDVLFISPMYVMFKSKIPGTIKKCMCDLRKEAGSQFLTVFLTKSKMVGEVRAMLFVKGKYVKDISIEDFIKL